MVIKRVREKAAALRVDAAAAADYSGSTARGSIALSRTTQGIVIKMGLLKWQTDDCGEEEVLRSALARLFAAAQTNGIRSLALDMDSLTDRCVGLCYVTSVVLEEALNCKGNSLELWLASSRSVDNGMTNLFTSSINGKSQLNANMVYGDCGDSTKEQFESFQREMKKEDVKDFRSYLLAMLDAKGFKKAPDVYRASGISKSTFSKITSFVYTQNPSRETVAALTIGLRLNLAEAEGFYRAAGFSLTKTIFLDKVIRFFIQQRRYNLDEVNYCLDFYQKPPLGFKTKAENPLWANR